MPKDKDLKRNQLNINELPPPHYTLNITYHIDRLTAAFFLTTYTHTRRLAHCAFAALRVYKYLLFNNLNFKKL